MWGLHVRSSARPSGRSIRAVARIARWRDHGLNVGQVSARTILPRRRLAARAVVIGSTNRSTSSWGIRAGSRRSPRRCSAASATSVAPCSAGFPASPRASPSPFINRRSGRRRFRPADSRSRLPARGPVARACPTGRSCERGGLAVFRAIGLVRSRAAPLVVRTTTSWGDDADLLYWRCWRSLNIVVRIRRPARPRLRGFFASALIPTPSSPRRIRAASASSFIADHRRGDATAGIRSGRDLAAAGDYLAIVTLGRAEIHYILLVNLDRPVTSPAGRASDLDRSAVVRGVRRDKQHPVLLPVPRHSPSVLVASGAAALSRSLGWQAIRERARRASHGINTNHAPTAAFAIAPPSPASAAGLLASCSIRFSANFLFRNHQHPGHGHSSRIACQAQPIRESAAAPKRTRTRRRVARNR